MPLTDGACRFVFCLRAKMGTANLLAGHNAGIGHLAQSRELSARHRTDDGIRIILQCMRIVRCCSRGAQNAYALELNRLDELETFFRREKAPSVRKNTNG